MSFQECIKLLSCPSQFWGVVYTYSQNIKMFKNLFDLQSRVFKILLIQCLAFNRGGGRYKHDIIPDLEKHLEDWDE